MASVVRAIMLLVCLTVREAYCDYSCLCSYQVELEIFEKPDPSSNVDGYMYEFDCKPFYKVAGLDPAYSAVGNEGKLGYVTMTTNIQIQTCQGSIPDIDRVKPTSTLPPTTTTTIPPSTTPMTIPTTTPPPTNATPSTTVPPPATKTTVKFTPTASTILTTTTAPPTTSVTTRLPTSTTTSSTTSSTTTSPTTSQVTPNSCPVTVKQKAKPQNLFQSRGICYEFVPTMSSWKHAQGDCKSKGGYLVSIENADQQNYVSSILTSVHKATPVWLGLHDRVNEEQWEWDTGVNASYFNWSPGRYIDQYHDQEDCALMVPVRKHQWDDVDCNGITFKGLFSYPWICQYT